MKTVKTITCLLSSLLLSACVSGPPSSSSPRPQVEGKPADSAQQAAPAPPAIKSIVPDINAEGRRGEIARMMLNKSSRQFLRADMNKDYRISADEADEHLPFIAREFGRYDSNSDGGVDWQEFLGHDEWPTPSH